MQTATIFYLMIYSSIIAFAFCLLPYVIYKRFSKSMVSFDQWLGCFNVIRVELAFSALCLLTLMIFGAIHMILPLIFSFYASLAGRKIITNHELTITHTRKWLYTFIVAFTLFMIIQIAYLRFGLWETAHTIQDYRWLQLPLVCTIFSGIIFKARLREFNWSIHITTGLYVLLLFVILKLSYVVAVDFSSLQGLPPDYFLRNFIQQIYYPSLVEEIIFRGFLLRGLLSVGMDTPKANILQAIVFGLIHAISPAGMTLVAILSTSFQIYVGYLIGNVYLTTKSLTPCIILHALIDTL